MAPCEVFLPACTLHFELDDSSRVATNAAFGLRQGSKSMPVSPCYDLNDDSDAQFAKVSFDACVTFANLYEDHDVRIASKMVESSFLPYKSPCAAYFDGGDDDFSFAHCDALCMSPPSKEESSRDAAAPCIDDTTTFRASNPVFSCAINTADCFTQSLHLKRSPTCAWKGLPSKIQYSFDTLSSRCDETCAYSVDAGAERNPLKLIDLVGLPGEKTENFMDGKFWELSQDAQGCRQVQNALDDSLNSRHFQSIQAQLKGHVWEAMRCPHANHVLRKVVQSMPSSNLDFIIEEVVMEGSAGVRQFASHRYGCRIVEELLRSCSVCQLEGLLALMLVEAEGLCTHMYGNFAMKAFLRHSSSVQRQRLLKVLLDNATTMGTNFYACAVLTEVLQNNDEDSRTLARVIVSVNGLMSAMACHKHGRAAVEAVLRVFKGEDLKGAITELALPPLKVAKASKVQKNPRH